MCFPVSREALLSFKNDKVHLPSEVWRKIKYCGIQRPKRGTRAGMRIQRRIKTLITEGVTCEKVFRGQNPHNLILVNFQNSSIENNNMKIGLINARSVANKSDLLRETIIDNGLSLLAITETWLRDGDEPITSNLCPADYAFHGAARPRSKGCRGGGIGIVAATGLISPITVHNEYYTFEALSTVIRHKRPTTLVLIYRPPPSQANGLTTAQFLTEIETLLSSIVTDHPGEICVVGDFNLHMDNEMDPNCKQFRDILNSLDLHQHVQHPTHYKGHILDLVITRSCDRILKNLHIHDTNISDHQLICFEIAKLRQANETPALTIRSLKQVKPNSMAALITTQLQSHIHNNLEDLVTLYDRSLTLALDVHAPRKTIKLKGVNPKPWYTDEIHQARIKRRQLERKYKKTGLHVHKEIWHQHQLFVIELIKQRKADYYHQKFKSANSKETFKILQQLLSTNNKMVLPSSSSDEQLADTFNNFFCDKVTAIRDELDNLPDPICSKANGPTPSCTLEQFFPVGNNTISDIIHKSATKSCKLDPIPTSLLKCPEIISILIPTIADICNQSLTSGTVPNIFKISHISPRLKKNGLNPEEMKSYRPVNNLSFISKVLEKVVVAQLTSYLKTNGLHDPLQSAYRVGHSTESAMLKIKSDIDMAIDAGDAVLLVLLDLSAAFDTIDHELLLVRLDTEVGIKGEALAWIRSYLTARFQSVIIREAISTPKPVTVGVPQGSVLGPLLFVLYILPLRKIIENYNCCRHGYADDTQLYAHLPIKNPSKIQKRISDMNKCIAEVRAWMLINKLKINDSKTECIFLGTKLSLAKLDDLNLAITVGTDVIPPSSIVKNLGAVLDPELSMANQISTTIKTSYFHLRRISMVKHYLDKDTRAKVIHSCVTSRLDYHNALLTTATGSQIKKLQLVQNNAARLISGKQRHVHITPVLNGLHWLPVKARIKYKVLSFIHHAIHNEDAPQYMKDLMTFHQPSRNLRSSNEPYMLIVERSKKRIGTNSYKVLGAKLWNALPAGLRCIQQKDTFKSKLKTHIFCEAFSDFPH